MNKLEFQTVKEKSNFLAEDGLPHTCRLTKSEKYFFFSFTVYLLSQ
ncbi:hypothetical protein SJDPG12_03235 [Porphyromonas gingivalis SJD12]|nr:hypothetical protein SJDPG12_03235 [Porphyromonas gingivalis SJD12]